MTGRHGDGVAGWQSDKITGWPGVESGRGSNFIAPLKDTDGYEEIVKISCVISL